MADPFATLADVESRYPSEAALLCADEETRAPDWARFEAALFDVSTEIRIILQARYTPAQLGDLDMDSLGALRFFAIDMVMYRVALSFARSTDAIKDRYDAAIARLEGIAKGRGALSFTNVTGGSMGADAQTTSSPGEAIVVAHDRQFGRDKMGGW